LHTVICNYTLLYVATHCYMWLHTVICGYILLYVATYCYTWLHILRYVMDLTVCCYVWCCVIK
ncbi:hypothetical protein LOTGIDRAFT_132766, partial [Lottia gigantea]